jgi:SAM-dependent methyltransferase
LRLLYEGVVVNLQQATQGSVMKGQNRTDRQFGQYPAPPLPIRKNGLLPAPKTSPNDPGYITDIEYTGKYYPQQSPAGLRYVATLNGYPSPRLDREFTYCELGCGKGVTSAVLAALFPQGLFHGCDLNPAHIKSAKALAKSAKLKNLEFHERSFAAMLEEKLPQFDFITLHGVWSWVPEPVRGEIARFLQMKLKPNGLAMVSYNAMPGWAHILPIRRMMHEYAHVLPGDSLEKVRRALQYVRHLADNGAVYFKANPGALEHLKSIEKSDLRYVAHEYITPHGDPFYFPEVCGPMRSAGLAFVGSMATEQNYAEIVAGPKLLPLLNTAPSRIVLETHRDFITNTRFRNDLYAAHPEIPRAPPLTLERLGGLSFSLRDLPEKLPLKGSSGGVTYNITGREAAVRAVHSLLEKGPADARAIQEAAKVGSAADAVAFLQQLVLVGHVVPCSPVPAAPGWSALNAAFVELALAEKQNAAVLIGPCSGIGNAYAIPYALMIDASTRLDDGEAAARDALARLAKHGQVLNRKTDSGVTERASQEFALKDLAKIWAALRDPQSANARALRLHGIL